MSKLTITTGNEESLVLDEIESILDIKGWNPDVILNIKKEQATEIISFLKQQFGL